VHKALNKVPDSSIGADRFGGVPFPFDLIFVPADMIKVAQSVAIPTCMVVGRTRTLPVLGTRVQSVSC